MIKKLCRFDFEIHITTNITFNPYINSTLKIWFKKTLIKYLQIENNVCKYEEFGQNYVIDIAHNFQYAECSDDYSDW